MKYFLGIDGGGTKTTAVVGDENGKIIFKSVYKSINFYSVGMDAARENLAEIIRSIKINLDIQSFSGAFIGCSALDGEADEETLNALCGGIIEAEKLKMDSDVYVALKSVGDAVCPCVAICGTGSMAIGENENGETVVKGGWGHILGDDGSAYSIALTALKLCCNFNDEGKNEKLITEACKYFSVTDFRKIIDIIYAESTKKDYIAGFAERVSLSADEGDEISKEIIISQASSFAKTVLCLLNEIKNCSVLALYGGVFQHNGFFREIFINKIRAKFSDLRIEVLTVPPEEGALKIARNLK